jgi:hypothetical protein
MTTPPTLSEQLRALADPQAFPVGITGREILNQAADAIDVMCKGCADTLVENNALFARLEAAEADAKCLQEHYEKEKYWREVSDGLLGVVQLKLEAAEAELEALRLLARTAEAYKNWTAMPQSDLGNKLVDAIKAWRALSGGPES